MFEAPLKVLRGETEISIEFHDEFPVVTPEGVVPVIKRFHDTATGFPESPVRSVYDADEWEPSCVLIDDLARSVSRAVIDNYPFRRLYGLSKNGSDGRFEVLFLVAHWRDDYITRHSTYTLTAACTAPRYSRRPSCHALKVFSPSSFRPRFSSTEYFGRGTLAGNSFGPATFRLT